MTKIDIVQGLSAEISAYIKKNLSDIKKLDKEDRQDVEFIIHILKKSIDKVK
jgi:hypothetical protein